MLNMPKKYRYLSLIIFLFPAILILRGGNGFPFPSAEAEFSDLAISHYPNALLIQRTIIDERQVPLWSPYILSGYPFAANPLSGLWYPPGWIALIFRLPFGFNLVAALHLMWGGYWFYRLLRLEGLSYIASLFGAFVFMMAPKLTAHYGAGHLTLFYAVTHTPILLYLAADFFTDRHRPNKTIRAGLLSGVIFGLIILADVRWSVYGLLAWGIFILFKLVHIQPRQIVSTLVYAGVSLITGFLLSASLLIPFSEYLSMSTRAQLDLSDSLIQSLPLSSIFGCIIPIYGGNHEWIVYAGIIPIVFLIVLLFSKKSNANHQVWIILLVVSGLISFGDNLPFVRWLYTLPGFNLLRVPPRSIFLTYLCLGAIFSYGIEQLLLDRDAVRWRWINIFLMGVVGFLFFLGVGLSVLSKSIYWEILWAFVLVILTWYWLRGSTKLNNGKQFAWIFTLLVVLTIDLGLVDLSLLSFKSKSDVIKADQDLFSLVIDDDNSVRTYSPSYSIPQEFAAFYGIQLADGVDPLQLKTYMEFMEKAAGVPYDEYSVTIPPFQTGNPKIDNRQSNPDPVLLGYLNVRYLVSEFWISDLDFTLVGNDRDTFIYENEKYLPRAVVYRSYSRSDDYHTAQIVDYTPNRIHLAAVGPGLLVLSEMNYPGWIVKIDGDPASIMTVDGLFRAVELSEGSHILKFNFRPVSVYTGIGISLVSLVIIFGILTITHRHGSDT